jgi:NADH/NAD ratio-sensing transcriptional regulator Rex
MEHRKVDVQESNEIWVSMNNLGDALSSKRLFPKPPFDVVQNFSVGRVVLIENVLQLQISRPKTIAEMLRENPTAICINGFLDGVAPERFRKEKGVIG